MRTVDETESTNDDAAALLGEPSSAGLVLRARHQRAGRGRRGRNWIAPPDSALLFTAILPRPVAAAHLWAVPYWAALGVADGIGVACALEPGLQWPNDLLLEGRKCGGILCVSRVNGDAAWVGCGIGLNVVRPAEPGALSTIAPPPAFLSDRAPQADLDALLAAILAAFERRLGDLGAPEGVARAWERRARLDGTPYRIARDGAAAPFEAVARRLGRAGELIVERAGREEAITLAEARVLR